MQLVLGLQARTPAPSRDYSHSGFHPLMDLSSQPQDHLSPSWGAIVPVTDSLSLCFAEASLSFTVLMAISFGCTIRISFSLLIPQESLD